MNTKILKEVRYTSMDEHELELSFSFIQELYTKLINYMFYV